MLQKKYKRFKKITNKKIYNKVFLFFDFLLVSDSLCYFSDTQFEMSRKLISKSFKKYGKDSFFFFVKPYFYLTSKPSESRMGGGKGSFSFKIFPIRKGQIFLGFKGIPILELINILNLLSTKLPFKFRLIKGKY